jgi:hypothetical protein
MLGSKATNGEFCPRTFARASKRLRTPGSIVVHTKMRWRQQCVTPPAHNPIDKRCDAIDRASRAIAKSSPPRAFLHHRSLPDCRPNLVALRPILRTTPQKRGMVAADPCGTCRDRDDLDHGLNLSAYSSTRGSRLDRAVSDTRRVGSAGRSHATSRLQRRRVGCSGGEAAHSSVPESARLLPAAASTSPTQPTHNGPRSGINNASCDDVGIPQSAQRNTSPTGAVVAVGSG